LRLRVRRSSRSRSRRGDARCISSRCVRRNCEAGTSRPMDCGSASASTRARSLCTKPHRRQRGENIAVAAERSPSRWCVLSAAFQQVRRHRCRSYSRSAAAPDEYREHVRSMPFAPLPVSSWIGMPALPRMSAPDNMGNACPRPNRPLSGTGRSAPFIRPVGCLISRNGIITTSSSPWSACKTWGDSRSARPSASPSPLEFCARVRMSSKSAIC